MFPNTKRESTTSRKQHVITQRMTSQILVWVHGWLTTVRQAWAGRVSWSNITSIFAGLCIILREINHPLTGIHNIVRESTTSRKRHDITQRLTSHILETVHGWLTAHTTVYNKERGHTLLAREYDESTLPQSRGQEPRTPIIHRDDIRGNLSKTTFTKRYSGWLPCKE